MQSWLQECLIELADGRVFVTCDQRIPHEAPIRDTRWSYARYEPKLGASVDLMPALSLALLPDPLRSKRAREIARGQEEVARNQSGPKARAQYQAQAASYQWESDQLLQFSREMPTIVLHLDQTLVVAAFRNGEKDAHFRVVDASTGAIVVDISGADVDAMCGPPSRYRRSDEEMEALDQIRSQLDESLAKFVPPNEGVVPSRTKLLAANGDRLLFSLGVKGAWLFRAGGSSIEPLRSLGLFVDGWGCAAISRGKVLVCGAPTPGPERTVYVVDPEADKVLATQDAGKSGAVGATTSRSGSIAWISAFGNRVTCFDFETNAFTKRKLWSGLTRDDHYTLVSDAVGENLLLRVAQMDSERLALLHLPTGVVSMLQPAVELSATLGPHDHPNFRRIPGYCFVGSEPYAIRGGALEKLQPIAAEPTFRLLEPAPIPAALRARAAGALDEMNLGQLARIYHPGLNLTPVRVTTRLPTGATKFGGLPDLVSEMGSWPKYEGQPMCFLAQFNLAELAARCPDWRLPRSGLLSFFRAIDPEHDWPLWYDQESRADASMVLFNPDPDQLIGAARPRGLRVVGPECRLDLGDALPLPPMDAVRWRDANVAAEARDLVENLGMTLRPGGIERCHQLGGYTAYSLDSLTFPAERISRGQNQFGGFNAQSEEGRALIEAAAQWIPLAAFNSCSASGMEWGDGGMLAFMIRSSDLDATRFDKVIAVSWR
jgi:uncharacterized protein YwqG